jgi:two-component system, cell cycle response regulator
VTLRARLTGAFLAVVVGPVLVGGVFVAITVNAVNHTHERDRLDLATSTTRTVLGAACDRLQSTAETAATMTLTGTAPQLAQSLVDRGVASAIHIENADGRAMVTTTGAPATPWALCTPLPGVDPYDPSVEGPYTALAAVVEMRNPDGDLAGYVYAVQTLTPVFLASLASAAGAQLTILDGPSPVASSQSNAVSNHIASFASTLAPNETGSDRERYIRRIDPSVQQPFSIAVSVPVQPAKSLLMIVVAVAGFAAIAAIAAAWALARTTTKPLNEIAEAAGRLAQGDLHTRVPVRHDDEVGHVGAAFNRLSREMQSYSTALINSREQLRGNLDLLGDTLASTHDLPRIMRVMLASAVSATGAQAGMVLLTDPADDHLRMQCAEGFDESGLAQLAELAIAPGVGVVGAVAASGIARRGRPADPETGPVPIEAEPFCHTYLAVPLRSPAASPALVASASGVGVLVLYDRLGGADFDDTDLRTVRSFASHAAIAVDNVRAHAEAQRLSHTDPLTGLYNYRYLKELVRREVERSSRFGHTLCVIVLDLDRFKVVNDSYGHGAGDAVLIEFARRVSAEIRGVDLAFRYGGEEFVLLLPETDGLGGITLAQRLGTVVRESRFAVPGKAESGIDLQIAVTVSIGVAVFPEHGQTGTQILEAADDALYAAKAAGRDTFRLAIARPVVTPTTPVPVPVPAHQESMDVNNDTADAEIAAAGVGGPTSGGTLARWRGRDAGRSPGGASGTTPPPRQARGR